MFRDSSLHTEAPAGDPSVSLCLKTHRPCDILYKNTNGWLTIRFPDTGEEVKRRERAVRIGAGVIVATRADPPAARPPQAMAPVIEVPLHVAPPMPVPLDAHAPPAFQSV